MKLFSIAAPLIWAAIVLLLHLMRVDIDPDSGLQIPHADKVVHFGMFGVLAFLFVRSSNYNRIENTPFYGKLSIIAMCVLYGALMEYLQGLTPAQRDSDIYDWFADIAGSVGGALVAQTSFLPFFFKHEVRKSS